MTEAMTQGCWASETDREHLITETAAEIHPAYKSSSNHIGQTGPGTLKAFDARSIFFWRCFWRQSGVSLRR